MSRLGGAITCVRFACYSARRFVRACVGLRCALPPQSRVAMRIRIISGGWILVSLCKAGMPGHVRTKLTKEFKFIQQGDLWWPDDPVPHCSVGSDPELSRWESFDFESELAEREYSVTRTNRKTGRTLGQATLRYLSGLSESQILRYYAILRAFADEQLFATPVYLSKKSSVCGRFVVIETPDVTLRRMKEFHGPSDVPMIEALNWGLKALDLLDRLVALGLYSSDISIDTLKLDNGDRLMLDSVHVRGCPPEDQITAAWVPGVLSHLNKALTASHTPPKMSTGLTTALMSDSARRQSVQLLADMREQLEVNPESARFFIERAIAINSRESHGQFYKMRRVMRRLISSAMKRGVPMPASSGPVGRTLTASDRGGNNPVVHRYALLEYLRDTWVVPKPLSLSPPGTPERTLVQSNVGDALPSLLNPAGKWDYRVVYLLVEALAALHARGVYVDGPLEWTDVYFTADRSNRFGIAIDSDRLVFNVIKNERMCIQNLTDVAKILDRMVRRWTVRKFGQAMDRSATPYWNDAIRASDERFRLILAETRPGKRIHHRGMMAALRQADALVQKL